MGLGLKWLVFHALSELAWRPGRGLQPGWCGKFVDLEIQDDKGAAEGSEGAEGPF